ncbi:uncharacterized protein SOCG_00482 [Schizosaccharomyces octosporus yFS286]|uniref:Uncharacterized protein n=1 Tax=Schizosaccharomyces octosporus (strain yFS286) TaxID=483514 RepID=S9R2W5_SCHOY|nr:uncharacterized protein SOCG_00482 [Schizosaccharomyces octosporus yFS286]EPX72720.1 hypothetical protein SOCG_00482 [Schizosaccharomyces octosporus yFS286]
MIASSWLISLATAFLGVSSVAHAQTLTYTNANTNISRQAPMVMNMTFGDCTPYGLPVNNVVYDIQYGLEGVFSRDWGYVQKAIQEGKYLDAVAAANMVSPDGGVANLNYNSIIDMIGRETDEEQIESLQCLKKLIDQKHNRIETLMAEPNPTHHQRFRDTLDASIDRLNSSTHKTKRFNDPWGSVRNVGGCYGSHAAVRRDCGQAISGATSGTIILPSHDSTMNAYGSCFLTAKSGTGANLQIPGWGPKNDGWMIFWNCFDRNNDGSVGSGTVYDYSYEIKVCVSDRASGC